MNPPDNIVAAVRAELAVPGRYDLRLRAPAARSPWEIAVRWIVDRVGRFFDWIASHVHIGKGTSNVAGDVILLVALAIIAVVAARLLIAMQLAHDRRFGSVPIAQSSRSARSLAASALRSAEAGDYSAAVRAIFAASVVLLDLRGMLADDRAATVNELRRALRDRDEALEVPFVDIARAYTSAAYAETPAGRNDWEAANAAYALLAARAHA